MKIHLRAGIERTKRRLASFEARYGVDTRVRSCAR